MNVVRQRGMTLIEVTISAAIAILMAAVLFQPANGSRSPAASTAAASFDAALAYAKSLAATSGNGATLVFAAASPAPGFSLRIYSGRPTSSGALTGAPAMPISSTAAVVESALGPPPFSIFLDGSGAASGMRGALLPGQVLGNDPGCPAGETAIQLRFSAGPSIATRALPCPPP
jgi:type II secretory pathway pseudopilin PulG